MERAGCVARLRQRGPLGFGGRRLRRGRRGGDPEQIVTEEPMSRSRGHGLKTRPYRSSDCASGTSRPSGRAPCGDSSGVYRSPRLNRHDRHERMRARRPRAFQQRSDEGARGWLARSNRRRSAGQRRARNRPTSLRRKGQGHDLRPDARALSWGAPVRWIASVAVGAAAILSTSVAGAARDGSRGCCRATGRHSSRMGRSRARFSASKGPTCSPS